MSESREDRIRDRAYYLWVDDGRPEGAEHEYWARAEELVDAEENGHESSVDGAPPD